MQTILERGGNARTRREWKGQSQKRNGKEGIHTKERQEHKIEMERKGCVRVRRGDGGDRRETRNETRPIFHSFALVHTIAPNSHVEWASPRRLSLCHETQLWQLFRMSRQELRMSHGREVDEVRSLPYESDSPSQRGIGSSLQRWTPTRGRFGWLQSAPDRC